MNIANKTILITGANRGIGRALLHEALKRGARRVYAGTRSTIETVDKRVTPVMLDVTNAALVQRASEQVDGLDLLINNAGIALNDDLSNPAVIEQQFAVNFLGVLKMTRAFLPQLRQSKGAILNNLSLAAVAALPMLPGYSISKAAALSMTQSLRALLAVDGINVHAALIGPTDTDMNRGLDIPKASPDAVARGIFEGVEAGQEEIFPDSVSQSVADGWRGGVAKALERQFAGFVSTAAGSPSQ